MKSVHTFFSTTMICHGSQTLIQACDSIQPNILFMVLKSEGAAIQHVNSPIRDKRYAIVAYARLMSENAMNQHVDNECMSKVISGLIDLQTSTRSGFMMGSQLEKSGEEMLMDGAIDQTFAFGR